MIQRGKRGVRGRGPEAPEGRLFGHARRRGLRIVRSGILKAEICRCSFTPSLLLSLQSLATLQDPYMAEREPKAHTGIRPTRHADIIGQKSDLRRSSATRRNKPPPAGRGLLRIFESVRGFPGVGTLNSMSSLASEYLLRLTRALLPLQFPQSPTSYPHLTNLKTCVCVLINFTYKSVKYLYFLGSGAIGIFDCLMNNNFFNQCIEHFGSQFRGLGVLLD